MSPQCWHHCPRALPWDSLRGPPRSAHPQLSAPQSQIRARLPGCPYRQQPSPPRSLQCSFPPDFLSCAHRGLHIGPAGVLPTTLGCCSSPPELLRGCLESCRSPPLGICSPSSL